ncbi:MAG TPA: carbohydrate binding domain-containing protein [Candidatus Rifleibacterium sp.]|nr:carbohydrate binding domain-containing protein [Candidatus Rifleibacterium sp.]
MKLRRGYVLLGLLLFFTVLGLSGTVTVLEQDTRLKRFSEEDLKLNLDALRRGIDLYRYHYTIANPDAAKVTALETAMQAGPDQLADLLAGERFVRARVATGTMQWRIIDNLIKNPSFEIDDGTLAHLPAVGTWRGNYTANDGVPDGWKLNADGAEQEISITTASTYVVSFWARSTSATAKAVLRIRINAAATPALEINATGTEWKRYFGSFALGAVPATVRIELLQAGTTSGDTTFIDGLMLEKWVPPAGTPGGALPVASAWTDKYQIVPAQAVNALQERAFKTELTAPSGSDISSYSWWFQW